MDFKQIAYAEHLKQWKNNGCMVLLSGFEPESKPREGFMIGRYTTRA